MTLDDCVLPRSGDLDDALDAARRHQCALVLAIRTGDSALGQVAAARLRAALRRATIALDLVIVGEPAMQPILVSVFRQFTECMYDLLRRAPSMSGKGDPCRLARWLLQSGHSPHVDGPHVFELDASGADLGEARFLGVHVLDSRFITKLCHASFVNALIERSDFTYSDLRRTVWQGTRIVGSYFRDSSLADAAFEHTTFVDCDLRGVDLSSSQGEGTAGDGDIQFIRCDLRGVNWDGRDLSLLRVAECQLYDSDGAPARKPLQRRPTEPGLRA